VSISHTCGEPTITLNVESSKNEFFGGVSLQEKQEVLDFKVRRQGRLALDIITIRKLFK
jgi:hypothetical protein